MRAHCTGSNRQPLPAVAEEGYEDLARTQVTPTYTIHHDSRYGVCSKCHEPKRLLKSGLLPKHTRYLSYRDQQALAASMGGVK